MLAESWSRQSWFVWFWVRLRIASQHRKFGQWPSIRVPSSGSIWPTEQWHYYGWPLFKPTMLTVVIIPGFIRTWWPSCTGRKAVASRSACECINWLQGHVAQRCCTPLARNSQNISTWEPLFPLKKVTLWKWFRAMANICCLSSLPPMLW